MFYDAQENSTGTLVASLANDPEQIQQLLGINMAIGMTGLFNVIGCVAISFAFGWKLSLVAVASALPVM